MWQLEKTNLAKEWVVEGLFETVTDAARRISEIEDYPVSSLFLEMHVDTVHGNDTEAFGHLEHTGRQSLYVIKRCVN